jgi:hypothetical protein
MKPYTFSGCPLFADSRRKPGRAASPERSLPPACGRQAAPPKEGREKALRMKLVEILKRKSITDFDPEPRLVL